MRWLLGLLILVQLPVVMLVFMAGGTDGKKSSLILIWSVTIPIFFCALYALYRLITAVRLAPIDWLAIAIAFAPAAWLLWAISANVAGGRG